MHAVVDEREFEHFKRNSFFNLLWENLSFEEGEIWLCKIMQSSPELVPYFERFRTIDSVGDPRVFSYGESGFFSPATLRLIGLTGELKGKLGYFEKGRILQIGAGQGNWCKILSDAVGFKSYILVDLPEQLQLAKKCLEKWGVKDVSFFTPDELPNDAAYDLVISDMSFSEFNRQYQKLLFNKAILRSASGFILGHEFPKHFGVASLNVDQLKERFGNAGKFACLEIQKPSEDRGDYLMYWKK